LLKVTPSQAYTVIKKTSKEEGRLKIVMWGENILSTKVVNP